MTEEAEAAVVERLRRIAWTLVRGRDDLSVWDLISAGWLEYQAVRSKCRFESHAFQKARFAMIAELHRWDGSQRVMESTQEARKKGRRFRTWRYDPRPEHLSISEPGLEITDNPPTEGWHPSSSDLEEFRASLVQLSPKRAAVVEALVLDGESFRSAAERFGTTHDAVRQTVSSYLTRRRQACG